MKVNKVFNYCLYRCVGKFNVTTRQFQCVLVRKADQEECLGFMDYVNQTNSRFKKMFESFNFDELAKKAKEKERDHDLKSFGDGLNLSFIEVS